MKEQFINCYPLSKTLQFSLIPVGKTKDNFNKKLLLERDKQRAENYEKVKGYIDRFHKEYIESVLVNARGEKIDEYADLYWKSNKDDSDAKAMVEAFIQREFRGFGGLEHQCAECGRQRQ